jgi:hypothetical protein
MRGAASDLQRRSTGESRGAQAVQQLRELERQLRTSPDERHGRWEICSSRRGRLRTQSVAGVGARARGGQRWCGKRYSAAHRRRTAAAGRSRAACRTVCASSGGDGGIAGHVRWEPAGDRRRDARRRAATRRRADAAVGGTATCGSDSDRQKAQMLRPGPSRRSRQRRATSTTSRRRLPARGHRRMPIRSGWLISGRARSSCVRTSTT